MQPIESPVILNRGRWRIVWTPSRYGLGVELGYQTGLWYCGLRLGACWITWGQVQYFARG